VTKKQKNGKKIETIGHYFCYVLFLYVICLCLLKASFHLPLTPGHRIFVSFNLEIYRCLSLVAWTEACPSMNRAASISARKRCWSAKNRAVITFPRRYQASSSPANLAVARKAARAISQPLERIVIDELPLAILIKLDLLQEPLSAS
jgi:hypothetical protein